MKLVSAGEIKVWYGEHKPVTRQNLTWKSRMFIFQSPSLKSKASFDVWQVRCEDSKLELLPRYRKSEWQENRSLKNRVRHVKEDVPFSTFVVKTRKRAEKSPDVPGLIEVKQLIFMQLRLKIARGGVFKLLI